MINAWSLLHDELYGDDSMTIESATSKDYNDFWEGDGHSMIGNHLLGGMSDDTICFSANGINAADTAPIDHFSDTISLDLTMDEKTKLKKYKYSEDAILKELKDYITGTYNQHYSAGDDKIQTLDLIEACGDGESFCRSNILKYASRYDKKGTARRDIMKILHYAVLLMHFNDKNAQNEIYPQ